MVSPSSSVSIFSDGSLQVVRPAVIEPPPVPIWRVRHDVETIKGNWRPNLPEVHQLFDNHFTPFSESWQRLSYDLNNLSRDKWTAVYTYERAFTNGNGFAKPGDPRRNYIKMEDLTEPLPKVEALVCGGAGLTGKVSGDYLIVETLNGRSTAPSLAWLLARPWLYFDAVTVDGNGVPRRFPQGGGERVLIPLIADRTRYPQVVIPLTKLAKWSGPGMPDAYKVYL